MKNKARILSTTSLEPSLVSKAKKQNIIIDTIPFIEIEIITATILKIPDTVTTNYYPI